MNWCFPILQVHEARRRIWRESQRRRRAGLPYREKLSKSEAARVAALAKWAKWRKSQ